MAIRVARGLFRLWLVTSVLWIGFVMVMTWSELPDNWVAVFSLPPIPSNAASELRPGDPVTDPALLARLNAPEPEPVIATIVRGIEKAFIPPILVLIFAWAFAWAFRGFRQSTS